MGWSSGSRLMSDIIDAVYSNVRDKSARAKIYEILIPAFEDFDCDTLSECTDVDEEFDRIWYVQSFLFEMSYYDVNMDESTLRAIARNMFNEGHRDPERDVALIRDLKDDDDD